MDGETLKENQEPDTGPTAARNVVKSAARALDVFELFRRKRRALSAAEIGKALNYPKSSANALLKSLTSQGQLVLNAKTMHY